MANGFQWIFSLVDKVSKPAKDAEKATGGFEKELKKAEAQLEKIKQHPVEFKKLKDTKKELLGLTRGTKSLSDHFEELKGSIGHIGLVQDLQLGIEGMRMLGEAASQVVDVVADIGKEMIAAAGAQERYSISFTSLLGNKGGKETLDYIDKIYKSTELSKNELRGLTSELLTTGFSAKELHQVLPAALDVSGFLGGGIANVQKVAAALEHIKASGEIEMRSMQSLGLQYANVMKEIRKETGLTDKQIKAKMGTGKFADPVLHAVLQSIANKGGGKLGNTAEKMGGTIEARFKHLKEVPELIFEKWADSPGFARFSGAIQKIVDKLDPDGPNGQKIFASLEKASDQVAALVSQFADGNGIDEFVSDIADIPPELKKMRDFLKESWPWVKRITEAWLVFKSVNAVSSAAKTTKGAFGAVAKVAGIGGKGLGLAEKGATAALGVTGATVAVGAAAAASLLYAGYKTNEAVKELGGYKATFRDFKDWWRGDAPAIASQSTRVQASGATKPPVTHFHGDMNLTVNATGSNADEIASAVSQSLPGAVQQSLERMAVSSGAM